MSDAKRSRTRLVAGALVGAILHLTAGCTADDPNSRTAPPGDAPQLGGRLVVALTADVDSWNPYTTHELTSAGILELLYPRLVHESDDGGFIPWLAERWETSTDGRELTFHLRRDAVWSDGSAVTCDDVRFTHRIQRAEELAWAGAYLKDRILAVDCPDPRTVVFRFDAAYPNQMLDANDDAIVPASYAAVPLADWPSEVWEDRIVSCGPFLLVGVRRGQEAILERDPHWWGAGETHLDQVVLRVYADSASAVNQLLEGDVDLVGKLPPLRAAEVEAHDDLQLLDLASLSYTYLGWNALEPQAYRSDRRRRGCMDEGGCDEFPGEILRLRRSHPHPILSDAEVRRAISLAIDRRDLIDGLLSGYGQPGSSPIASALWAHDPSTALAFDPRAAGALLDRAGWVRTSPASTREKDGTPLVLRAIINGENRMRREILDRVAASLAGVGVVLEAEILPRREFVVRARNKQFDAVLSGWWAGTRIQPQDLLHTRAAAGRGNNLVSWSTPESDELLDRGARATSRDEALQHWLAWQKIFRDEQPLSILYEERRLVGVSRRVRGPEPSYLNPYLVLHRWWIAAENTDTR
ncbi:MAG: hypothetical protein GY716_22725 [bacterium]|nr:hypothetical protein [bacterium]